jgi:SWI/SNF related-matrix-associated actin-dependent regulator of chromatin subfamily C
MAQDDYHLCAKCFASGFYPVFLASADFVRIGPEMYCAAPDEDEDGVTFDSVAPSSGGAHIDPEGWAPADTLRLLEALEQYGENWKSVAAHVGNKSVDACILHFIQLPLEEPFLSPTLATWTPTSARADYKTPGDSVAIMADRTAATLPFATTPNPVRLMSII